MYQMIAQMAMQVVGMGQQNEVMAKNLYAQQVQRATDAYNAMEELSAGTRQIANTKNGRILSNLDVQANRRQAEAQEVVNAAVHGVEGTTVQQVQAQQDYNAAAATGQLDSYFSQQYSAAIDQIESAGYTLSSSMMPPFQGSSMKFLRQHFAGPENPLAEGSLAGTFTNQIGGYD